MIYITQVIYIHPRQETVFDEFERVAIPAIARHKGQLLFRIRPTAESFIENTVEPPYEIHLVRFASQQDFDSFKQDEERRQFLHLKEQAIRASLLIQGTELH